MNGAPVVFNGRLLRELRQGRKLSLSRVAEIVTGITGERITYNSVFRWEAGLSEPRFSHAVALAQLMRIQLDRFVGKAQ